MRLVDIECPAVTEVIGRRAFISREDIQEFLDNIPTVEAEPVAHGKWVPSGRYYSFYMCSVCRSTNKEHQPFYRCVWKYCPNCGAVMS